jgi:hypothetical protein
LGFQDEVGVIHCPKRGGADEMADFFWFSDEQWARIEPLLPTDARGKERVDGRVCAICSQGGIGTQWSWRWQTSSLA